MKEAAFERDDLCRHACVSQHVCDVFPFAEHTVSLPKTIAAAACAQRFPAGRSVCVDTSFESFAFPVIFCDPPFCMHGFKDRF